MTAATKKVEMFRSKYEKLHEALEPLSRDYREKNTVSLANKLKSLEKEYYESISKYKDAVQACRSIQNEFFLHGMPEVLKELQEWELERCQQVKSSMDNFLATQQEGIKEMLAAFSRAFSEVKVMDEVADFERFLDEKTVDCRYPLLPKFEPLGEDEEAQYNDFGGYDEECTRTYFAGVRKEKSEEKKEERRMEERKSSTMVEEEKEEKVGMREKLRMQKEAERRKEEKRKEVEEKSLRKEKTWNEESKKEEKSKVAGERKESGAQKQESSVPPYLKKTSSVVFGSPPLKSALKTDSSKARKSVSFGGSDSAEEEEKEEEKPVRIFPTKKRSTSVPPKKRVPPPPTPKGVAESPKIPAKKNIAAKKKGKAPLKQLPPRKLPPLKSPVPSLQNLKSQVASKPNGNNSESAETLLNELDTLVSLNDYYGLFGVNRDASISDITKRRREISREQHPDNFAGDPGAAQVAVKKLALVNEVFANVMKSEEARENYNKLCNYRPHYKKLLSVDEGKLRLAINNMSLLSQSMRKLHMPVQLITEIEKAIEIVRKFRNISPN